MFRKLQRKMTLFCIFVTGFILAALSCTCLFFAESNMRRNNYASFLKEVNTIILHLQGENSISHQWLNQTHDNNNFQIYLYDNGQELFYQMLHTDSYKECSALLDKVQETAKKDYTLDIFQGTSSLFPIHEEFSIKESGQSYHVSTGIIPKSGGDLSFIILLPLTHQHLQILTLRLFIFAADLSALGLLSVFSWFFTGKMLIPLEENRKKQTQFVASASHELRTPLTVILSALEALKKTDMPEKQAHFQRIMEEEGHRMQHLISDMLLLANSDSKHFCLQSEPCQPDGILLNVYEKYETLAKRKQIGFRLTLPDELLPDCCCDRERMIQVLSILIDNALSYTPKGGSVTLSLHLTSAKRFRFAVADTGPGIADSEKKLVFERFYRSDNAHSQKEHFGLGLCIAREIITAHKGKLWIADNAPCGTVFFIEL